MTLEEATNNLMGNLHYLSPACYRSHSGSHYIFLPHGVIRISYHDTRRPVKWKLFPKQYKVNGRRCYGAGEIGAMIVDIKSELNSTEFAGGAWLKHGPQMDVEAD